MLKLHPLPKAMATAFTAIPSPQAAIELLALAKAATGGQVTGCEIMPRIGLDYVLRHTPATSDPIAGRHPWYLILEFSSGRDDGAIAETMGFCSSGTTSNAP